MVVWTWIAAAMALIVCSLCLCCVYISIMFAPTTMPPEKKAAHAVLDTVADEVAGKPLDLARADVIARWPDYKVLVVIKKSRDQFVEPPKSVAGQKVIMLEVYEGTIVDISLQYDGTKLVGRCVE